MAPLQPCTRVCLHTLTCSSAASGTFRETCFQQHMAYMDAKQNMSARQPNRDCGEAHEGLLLSLRKFLVSAFSEQHSFLIFKIFFPEPRSSQWSWNCTRQSWECCLGLVPLARRLRRGQSGLPRGLPARPGAAGRPTYRRRAPGASRRGATMAARWPGDWAWGAVTVATRVR